MSEKTLTLTINDKQYQASEGEKVLEVILRHKIQVPHFCYHPKLSVVGVCRMCLVEVEGARKLEVSCALPVRDGMVIRTESESVQQGRQSVMEFTLVNHPLDCPICDQAGECWLQEYYMDHDRVESHLKDNKILKDKAKPIGPRVMLDQERCILCTRCVRFCDEITETSELGIFNRGDQSVLDVAKGRELNNSYSENVVDICPVGALTSRDFRFDGRVWFLKESPSVCPGCARGCNTVLHHRDGTVRRILPRHNEEVNGYWMCDAGRDIHHEIHAENRMKTPLKLDGNDLKPVTWNEAFEITLGHLKNSFKDSSKKILGMGSVRSSNEDNYAFSMFLKDVLNGQSIYWEDLEARTWQGDNLLKHSDRNPNTLGAKKIIESIKGLNVLNKEDLFKELEKSTFSGLILLNQEIFEIKDSSLKKRLQKCFEKLDFVISFHTHKNELASYANINLPITTFAEQNGTFVNCDGIEQKFQKAIEPVAESLPLIQVLSGLADGLGVTLLENFFPDYEQSIGTL